MSSVRSGIVRTSPDGSVNVCPAFSPFTFIWPYVARTTTFFSISYSRYPAMSLEWNPSQRKWCSTSLTTPIVAPPPHACALARPATRRRARLARTIRFERTTGTSRPSLRFHVPRSKFHVEGRAEFRQSFTIRRRCLRKPARFRGEESEFPAAIRRRVPLAFPLPGLPRKIRRALLPRRRLRTVLGGAGETGASALRSLRRAPRRRGRARIPRRTGTLRAMRSRASALSFPARRRALPRNRPGDPDRLQVRRSRFPRHSPGRGDGGKARSSRGPGRDRGRAGVRARALEERPRRGAARGRGRGARCSPLRGAAPPQGPRDGEAERACALRAAGQRARRLPRVAGIRAAPAARGRRRDL